MRVPLLVCLLVCGTANADALAQSATGGSIRGYVTDEQRAVLRGVQLTATSPDAPGVHTAISDDSGAYHLLDLPPGTYTLQAALDGFTTWVHEGIDVRAGLNLPLSIEMRIGNRTESIQVVSETPLIESRSATQAVNVSGDLQRAVPLSGRRNWADSLLLAPGVVSQETNNNTQFFYAHGSDFGSNSFQLDGVDIGAAAQSVPQFINLSTEVIQDVQIKGTAVDASTPLGLGASLNVTTKSGTNELRGALSLVFRPERWNDNNVSGGTASKTRFTQPDLAIGGPIAKDRWWFFGSYRRLDASTGVSRTSSQIAAVQSIVPGFAPFDLSNEADLYFAKTTFVAGPSHRISASYQRDPSSAQTASADATTATTRTQGGNAVQGRLQSMWTGSLTTQVTASYNDKGVVSRAANADQPARIAYQSTALSAGRLVGVGRLVAYGATGVSSSVTPGEKLTITGTTTLFKKGWRGSHQFEAGVFLQPRLAQRMALDYVNGGAAAEDRVLVDPADASKGTRIFHTLVYDNSRQQTSDLTGSDNAFYLQDSWNPAPPLTVSAGVRVDFIRRTDNIFHLSTQRSHEIGPRVGVSYAATADGRTVARVSWTRVHETPAQNWISLGSSAAGFTDRYDFNGDGIPETAFVTAPSTALNSALVLDTSQFHQPYADEWNAGSGGSSSAESPSTQALRTGN